MTMNPGKYVYPQNGTAIVGTVFTPNGPLMVDGGEIIDVPHGAEIFSAREVTDLAPAISTLTVKKGKLTLDENAKLLSAARKGLVFVSETAKTGWEIADKGLRLIAAFNVLNPGRAL